MPVALLVEDDENDRDLFARLLTHGPGDWRVDAAVSLGEAVRRSKDARADVVLLDLRLPDSSGIESVRRLVSARPELPVVVLTGLDDEGLGLLSVKEGAQDYLVKGHVDRKLLDRSLRYAMERKRAELAMARLAAVTSALCDECGRRVKRAGLGTLES